MGEAASKEKVKIELSIPFLPALELRLNKQEITGSKKKIQS